MSPSVICYPQPGKAKSRAILEAFAAGCGGAIAERAPPVPAPGAVAFFGVVGIEYLLRIARAEERDWYYGDNAFFDAGRGRFFRFARRAFQASPLAAPDPVRLKALRLEPAPWQMDGRHVVVVEQSAHFLELCGAGRDWLQRVLLELHQHTDRPIVVRHWSRDKQKASAGLREDLGGAWALVTHASAAANEALLAGVPAFVSDPRCAAAPMAAGELSEIERPRRPEGRLEWAARLAASQWTLDELRSGNAWRTLNGHGL